VGRLEIGASTRRARAYIDEPPKAGRVLPGERKTLHFQCKNLASIVPRGRIFADSSMALLWYAPVLGVVL
jgi:hypothetical protein